MYEMNIKLSFKEEVLLLTLLIEHVDKSQTDILL